MLGGEINNTVTWSKSFIKLLMLFWREDTADSSLPTLRFLGSVTASDAHQLSQRSTPTSTKTA